ncbi:hypothetical protein Bbelb_388920 [Branchiostoma belcheri]|nr:hypothetical protein Bbelb_388920 [Branchiostoma belcheri]
MPIPPVRSLTWSQMKEPCQYHLYGALPGPQIKEPCLHHLYGALPGLQMKGTCQYHLYGALPGPQIKEQCQYYLHGALPGPQMKGPCKYYLYRALPVAQKWRDDYRCGDGYTTGDGRTAECDPDSIWPCCSPVNWCGNTAAHCNCAGCVDYRNTEIGDRKLEKITIGGKGQQLRIKLAYGVAVSADNEIFVTDTTNAAERVQVFSMNGIYLRHIPTVLPDGKSYISPSAVAIGVEPGYLWVLGGKAIVFGEYKGLMHVVQYSKTGQAIKKFDVQFTRPFVVPVMAIDVRNNKLIVGHRGNNNRVDMFTSRGEFVRTIANIQDPSGIAMGPDGEMVVTNSSFESTVTIFPRHMVNP